MTAAAPLLLDEIAARELLGGVNPEKVAPPIHFGAKKRWARAALEKAVNRAAGLEAPASAPDKSSAYDAWKSDK